MHKPIVIAGSLAQFADWCEVHQTHPLAAVYVETPAELHAALLKGGDVRLWGDCASNPAYRSWLLTRAA